MTNHRDRRNVPDHRREDHANSRLAVGRDDHVGAFVVERHEPQHVLDRGDAAVEQLDCADQRARAHSSLLRFAPMGSV